MWKKDEMPDETQARVPAQPYERTPERPAPAPVSTSASATSSRESATIGRSITVRGDVTGDEDLVIQGRVEGSVDLKQHSVTVGPDGEVNASIIGRVVTIEGRVEGNIDGGEQVILRNSALVQGDITAPRVVLENGARFRGLVDMGDVDERSKRTGEAKSNASGSRPGSPATSSSSTTSNGNGAKDAGATSSRSATPSESTSSTKGTSSSSSDRESSAATSQAGKGRRSSESEAQISI